MTQAEQMSPEQQAWMEAMQPNENHKLLEPLVGTFKAKVTMWMEPGGDPTVSEGIMVNKWSLGGRYVEHEYEGDSFGGKFEGKGFMGFDNTSQQFQGFWIDTASTMMQTSQGDFDAKSNTFTMRGEMICPSSKQHHTKRDTVKITDNDHHSMEMFFTGPDGVEHQAMLIEYERTG